MNRDLKLLSQKTFKSEEICRFAVAKQCFKICSHSQEIFSCLIFLSTTGELHSISEEAGVSIGVCKHLLKALLAYLRAGAKKGLTAPLLQQQLTTLGVEGPKVRLVYFAMMYHLHLCKGKELGQKLEI